MSLNQSYVRKRRALELAGRTLVVECSCYHNAVIWWVVAMRTTLLRLRHVGASLASDAQHNLRGEGVNGIEGRGCLTRFLAKASSRREGLCLVIGRFEFSTCQRQRPRSWDCTWELICELGSDPDRTSCGRLQVTVPLIDYRTSNSATKKGRKVSLAGV